MKKTIPLVLIAAAHFGLTRIVQASMLLVSSSSTFSLPQPLIERLLVSLSKALYFPLISLALYPRQLFPGNFILIPIFFNSLIWAVCLYVLWVGFQRMRRLRPS